MITLQSNNLIIEKKINHIFFEFHNEGIFQETKAKLYIVCNIFGITEQKIKHFSLRNNIDLSFQESMAWLLLEFVCYQPKSRHQAILECSPH